MAGSLGRSTNRTARGSGSTQALIVVACMLFLLAGGLWKAYSGWKKQKKAFERTSTRSEMTTSSASFLARGVFGLANKK